MQISIAICTWNRAASLARTLETVHAACQDVPSVAEVLVVNNNSTDHTDAVIARFSARLPLRRVFEPRPGISHARNAAIDFAAGDYLIWADDDVLVDRRWVAAYLSAFRVHPDAGFFGGPIIPLFEGRTPPWLADSWRLVGTAYGLRDFGQVPLRLHSDRLPYGANFAVRVSELKSLRCSPRLGRRPSHYWLVGEETELFRRLLSLNVQGWWVPGARVRHRIPPERQTATYLRHYFIGCGRTEMLLWDQPPSAALRIRRRLGLCRNWLKAEWRHQWLRTTKGPDAWVPACAESSLAWGRLRASHRPPNASDPQVLAPLGAVDSKRQRGTASLVRRRCRQPARLCREYLISLVRKVKAVTDPGILLRSQRLPPSASPQDVAPHSPRRDPRATTDAPASPT